MATPSCQDGETQHDTAAGRYVEPRANRAESTVHSRAEKEPASLLYGPDSLAIWPLETYIHTSR